MYNTRQYLHTFFQKVQSKSCRRDKDNQGHVNTHLAITELPLLLFFLLFINAPPPHTHTSPTPALVGVQHKREARPVPHWETIQRVITSDSAIHWRTQLTCGLGVDGCGGEIGSSDSAQG